jgi:hypothetical protein
VEQRPTQGHSLQSLPSWCPLHLIKSILELAKGLAKQEQGPIETDSEPAVVRKGKSIEKEFQSLKWNLWHGNVERALERIEALR